MNWFNVKHHSASRQMFDIFLCGQLLYISLTDSIPAVFLLFIFILLIVFMVILRFM